MTEIKQDQAEHVTHIFKEAQRKYDQVTELVDEICESLDVSEEQSFDVFTAVTQNWTVTQLLTKLEIKISLPRAEDELKYTAKEGWTRK